MTRQLEPHEHVWLGELHRLLAAGLPIDQRKMLVDLREGLPRNFRPGDVDRALVLGQGPSAWGLLQLGTAGEILNDLERTILYIRNRLTNNPDLTEITAEEVAENLGIPARRAQSLLLLTTSVGSFASNSNPLHNGQFGHYKIGVGGQDVLSEYLGFDSLETTLRARHGSTPPAAAETTPTPPGPHGMDRVVLLSELRALAESPPNFSSYTPTSRPHLDWMAKADALLTRWDRNRVRPFRMAMAFLGNAALRDSNVGALMQVMHTAIADLELEIPTSRQQVFGPGAVYDFLRALREIVGSASSTILVVDPYLDDQIFDVYLSPVSSRIQVRLLTQKYAPSLKASLAMFRAQMKLDVQIRHSPSLHDRVVCVDDRSCWVLGQSIKDAAKTKPTYMAPLAPDAAELKIAFYKDLWNAAASL